MGKSGVPIRKLSRLVSEFDRMGWSIQGETKDLKARRSLEVRVDQKDCQGA